MNFNFHKISLICFILIALLACSSWEKEPTIPPPCPIEDLMIDISLFPTGWFRGDLPSKRGAPIRWGIDKLGVSFTTQEYGGAIQVVYRGRNLNHAEKGYSNLSESWFHLQDDEGDWYVPSEFNYKSPIADQYRFGCSIHQPSGFQTCQMSAQHQVYLIRFVAGMSSLMTYNDLDRILRTIDEKMAQCLSK